jgi:hypothetical protein
MSLVSRTTERALALCGLIGPAAFTAAWAIGTVRQPGYSVAHEHISGLAAPDAETPLVMTAGFLALGSATVGFAAALDRRLSGHGHGARSAGAGPALIGVSGLTMVAAGLFRRDRMSNHPAPGESEGQSWVNDIHDTASVVGAVASSAGLFALAMRLRREPGLQDLARPTTIAAVAGTGLLAWFARGVTKPGNGLIQRAGVTIPLALMARLAVRLLRTSGR